MNLQGMTLGEVAAVVDAKLREHGVHPVVVGGSAVTAHVPEVYTSDDIDLAIVSGIRKNLISAALRELGFELHGRSFANPTTPFTVDIVADTPWVDQRAVTSFATITTRFGTFETVQFEDAIADRIAAFLYWNDSSSLELAERAVAAAPPGVSWEAIALALGQLESGSGAIGKRYELAFARLQRAYDARRHHETERPGQ